MERYSSLMFYHVPYLSQMIVRLASFVYVVMRSLLLFGVAYALITDELIQWPRLPRPLALFPSS
jgi:hypothetical protein